MKAETRQLPRVAPAARRLRARRPGRRGARRPRGAPRRLPRLPRRGGGAGRCRASCCRWRTRALRPPGAAALTGARPARRGDDRRRATGEPTASAPALRLGSERRGGGRAAVLVSLVLPGGGDGEPEQHVKFASLPAGVKIYATLEPHAYGTEIRMYVKGVRSGTLCRVYLQARDGMKVPAGTFRYRWGDDSTAVLSSALDLSRTARSSGRARSAPATGLSSPRSSACGRRSKAGRARGPRPAAGPRARPDPRRGGAGRRPGRRSGR